MIMTGENRSTVLIDRNLPHCHFIYHKSHTGWPGIERGPKIGPCYVMCLVYSNTTMNLEVSQQLQAFRDAELRQQSTTAKHHLFPTLCSRLFAAEAVNGR